LSRLPVSTDAPARESLRQHDRFDQWLFSLADARS
jgi:hypothetical protein